MKHAYQEYWRQAVPYVAGETGAEPCQVWLEIEEALPHVRKTDFQAPEKLFVSVEIQPVPIEQLECPLVQARFADGDDLVFEKICPFYELGWVQRALRETARQARYKSARIIALGEGGYWRVQEERWVLFDNFTLAPETRLEMTAGAVLYEHTFAHLTEQCLPYIVNLLPDDRLRNQYLKKEITHALFPYGGYCPEEDFLAMDQAYAWIGISHERLQLFVEKGREIAEMVKAVPPMPHRRGPYMYEYVQTGQTKTLSEGLKEHMPALRLRMQDDVVVYEYYAIERLGKKYRLIFQKERAS